MNGTVTVVRGDLQQLKYLRLGTLGWDQEVVPHDHGNATVHFVAVTGTGHPVGCVSCGPEPPSALPTDAAPHMRFWGVAVELGWRNTGVGTALMGHVADHARATSAQVLWANARLSALYYYRQRGFFVTGTPFASTRTEQTNRVVYTLLRFNPLTNTQPPAVQQAA